MIINFHKKLSFPEIVKFAKEYDCNYYFPRFEENSVVFSDTKEDLPKFIRNKTINGINYTFKLIRPLIYEK